MKKAHKKVVFLQSRFSKESCRRLYSFMFFKQPDFILFKCSIFSSVPYFQAFHIFNCSIKQET